MCGRFAVTVPGTAIAQTFGIADALGHTPRYNVAPTQTVLAIRSENGVRTGFHARWGLAAPWPTAGRSGAPIVNARAESVASKPYFRAAYQHRRCLVPADGFYEWETRPDGKQPTLFQCAGGVPFALAGLWTDGETGPTCALLTTEANTLVGRIHDRMPVIVPPGAWDRWLAAADAPSAGASWFAPYPADAMRARPVSRVVNAARSEGPACQAPPEEAR
jgi:putative SOS response-associated peptidase YedK